MAEKTIEIRLPYGESFKTIHISEKNLAGILETRQHRGLENEWKSILDNLRNPTGSVALLERIDENDQVVIIVTDNTRACPEDRILPPVLEELEKKISRDNITIIFALGLHPPLNRAQMEKKLGKDIVDNYWVLNHDVNDCVNIGITSRGTPIDVNRRVVEADFRISTGFIEPHFFAGFSGGPKGIMPGCAGLETVQNNHGVHHIAHPNATFGVTEGNPLWEELRDIALRVGPSFLLNVTLNKNRQITGVFAGDLLAAHRAGCDPEGPDPADALPRQDESARVATARPESPDFVAPRSQSMEIAGPRRRLVRTSRTRCSVRRDVTPGRCPFQDGL